MSSASYPPGAHAAPDRLRGAAIINLAYANGGRLRRHSSERYGGARTDGGPPAEVGVASRVQGLPTRAQRGFDPDPAARDHRQFDYIYNWLFLNAVGQRAISTAHFDDSVQPPRRRRPGKGRGWRRWAGASTCWAWTTMATTLVQPTTVEPARRAGIVLCRCRRASACRTQESQRCPHGDPPVSEEIVSQLGLQTGWSRWPTLSAAPRVRDEQRRGRRGGDDPARRSWWTTSRQLQQAMAGRRRRPRLLPLVAARQLRLAVRLHAEVRSVERGLRQRRLAADGDDGRAGVPGHWSSRRGE